jgi:hypothetical protein
MRGTSSCGKDSARGSLFHNASGRGLALPPCKLLLTNPADLDIRQGRDYCPRQDARSAPRPGPWAAYSFRTGAFMTTQPDHSAPRPRHRDLAAFLLAFMNAVLFTLHTASTFLAQRRVAAVQIQSSFPF